MAVNPMAFKYPEFTTVWGVFPSESLKKVILEISDKENKSVNDVMLEMMQKGIECGRTHGKPMRQIIRKGERNGNRSGS